ncbi:lysostaphin resistance A-like protein [Egicoccus sp. AB-alg2]|uniref:CPBP family intramembrane glutamic endopeptidase n=1 Tax=Egicoccus sp. AB-alg2 TaxID=3242693 RepID=UPI00359ECD64
MSQPPVPPPGPAGGRPGPHGGPPGGPGWPPGPAGPPSGPPGGDPAWPGGGRRDGSRAAEAFPVPFSAADGALLVLWSLVAQFLVVLPAMFLGIVDGNGGATMLLLVVVAQGVGLAGALAYLAARGRLSWRLLGPVRPSGIHWAVGLVVGIGGFIGVNVIIAVVLQFIGPVDPPEQQLLQDLTAGGVSTVLAIVAAVVMAPLVEEVVFRGVLFQGLKRRVGLWPAALVSGLIFAAVHVEVTQPIYSAGLLALGVALAWSMHRFGSLIVPIVGHAAFNAVSVGLTLLGGRFMDTI